MSSPAVAALPEKFGLSGGIELGSPPVSPPSPLTSHERATLNGAGESVFRIGTMSEVGVFATGDAWTITLRQLDSAHQKIEDLLKETAMLKEHVAVARSKLDVAEKLQAVSVECAVFEAQAALSVLRTERSTLTSRS